MTSTTLFDLFIGLAVIAVVCVRQLSWRPIDPARMWKMPIVLGAVGIFSMARQTTAMHPVDGVILGLSAAFALASGALMGRIARFRPSVTDPGLIESRTGWLGVGIWAALVAVRVALDVAGHLLGSDLAISTGTILLVLALNRAASALVVSARRPRRAAYLAGK
jgi:hypothetical protein